MLYVAMAVAALSVFDLGGSIWCAMTDRLPMAYALMVNGLVLGLLITGRAFG